MGFSSVSWPFHTGGNAKEAYFRLIDQANTLKMDKEKSSQE